MTVYMYTRRLPVPARSWALSTHPSGQLVCMSTRTATLELGPEPWRCPQHARALEATRGTRECFRGRGTRTLGSEAADGWTT